MVLLLFTVLSSNGLINCTRIMTLKLEMSVGGQPRKSRLEKSN